MLYIYVVLWFIISTMYFLVNPFVRSVTRKITKRSTIQVQPYVYIFGTNTRKIEKKKTNSKKYVQKAASHMNPPVVLPEGFVFWRVLPESLSEWQSENLNVNQTFIITFFCTYILPFLSFSYSLLRVGFWRCFQLDSKRQTGWEFSVYHKTIQVHISKL